ncbi:hypothetical protein EDB85DRAFT_1982066 [Lactarius pseudohatsudake]|nr:hypothetical protein EDB85DRAFT_1982066 [Lactarius pseudohatsudake]
MSLPRNAHAPSPPSPPPLSYGTPAPPSSAQDRTVGWNRARTTDSTCLTPFHALRLPVPLILFIYTFDLKVQTRSAEPVGPPNSMCTRRGSRCLGIGSSLPPAWRAVLSFSNIRTDGLLVTSRFPRYCCSPKPSKKLPVTEIGKIGNGPGEESPFSYSKESLCGLAP